MDKKRVLFICSLSDKDTQLRLIDEIGTIEPSLLSGEKRDEYDFIPRLGVRSNDLVKTIIGNKTSNAPFVLHFSMHGNEQKGLKFLGNNQEACYKTKAHFEGILEEMIRQGRKIKCVIFNVCYSLELAKSILPYVEYAIGVEGNIDDRAAIEFSRGFYQSLFDNSDETKIFQDSYSLGNLYIKNWMLDTDVTIEGGGTPYDKRFKIFSNP